MGQTAVHREASQATRQLLARIAAGPLGARLRAQLARRHPNRPADDIDDAFQEALQRGLVACRAEREYEVYSFLRVTMANWLADRGRLEARETAAGGDDPAFLDAPATDADPADQLAKHQGRLELRQLRCAVLARLSHRQRRVLALHTEGLERKAIAAREQASEKAIKKALERIRDVGQEEILSRAGHGCQEGEQLVARYAFRRRGDWAAAQLHIAGCHRCGGFFASLEAWRDRAASVLPFPAAEMAQPGTFAHLLERSGDAVAQLRDQLSGGATSAKQQLVDSAATLKQHTAQAWYRAVDPTPLAGVRPGAAAAVISGCIALGGGATYCIVERVDPVARLVDVIKPPPTQANPDRAARPKRNAQQRPGPPQLPPPPPEPEPAPTSPPPPPAPAANPQPAPPPEPPPPPPEQEQFDPAAAAAAEPAPQQPSPTPQQPAPAPDTGVGEFLGGP